MSDIGSVIPLESNPTIFTEFSRKLGLSPLISFFDIYSISDPDLISFLPKPLYALILLFPITDDYEALKNSEESQRDTIAQDNFENIVWFKQLLKNGCGLYALLHTLCNLPRGLLVNQSKVYNFMENLHGLENVSNSSHFDEKSQLISSLSLSLYDDFSKQGQTEAPNAEDDVNYHFICFTKGKNGHFFELDGRRNGPVDLGKPEGDANIDVIDSKAVLERIQQYMGLADEENKLKFAMVGLGPAMD